MSAPLLQPEPDRSSSRVTRRTLLALDGLIVVLTAAGLLIAASGGFHVLVAGIPVSARGALRPLILAALVAALRWWLGPRVPFLASRGSDWRRRLARLFLPQYDDVIGRGGGTWPVHATAVAGLCAVAVVLLYPQLLHMDSVPDHGDPLLSMWRAGWILEQLKGDPRGFFDANIFYPEPLTLTYSDSMILPALTAAPLLAAGVHPVFAYNLLLISGFVLSGVGAYLLVERLTGSARAGFVAGITYGFYPYHFEHYSHLELQMMQWMPLALLFVHRFLETFRWRDAVLFALCAVAQLYSSMYYGVFFAIYTAAVGAVLVAARRPALRRVIGPALVAAVLAGTLALPLIRPYAAATKTKGERGPDEVAAFSATPADYLRAHQRSALYGTRTLPGRQPERALFPGVVPIVLAGAGLVPPLGLTRAAYLAGLAVAFDGSLGFNGLSYHHLYDWFSPIRGLRVPARFSVLVALSLAVLGGFGARRMLTAARGRGRDVTFALLVAASIANVWPLLPLRPVWAEPPPIYGALAGLRHVVLAEFPVPPDYAYNTPYMYFALWHWAPMINGYSGFMPRSYDEFQKGVVTFPEPAAFATLRARGVTHVTVNCAFYRGGCEELVARLDALPDLRKVADGRWQSQPVRLYELVR